MRGSFGIILKVIKYNSPLLESFLTLTPERFNKLSTDIVLDVFDRISKKSYYFLTYQGKLNKAEETILFSIPEILPQPKEVKPLKSIDLQEESKLKVEEAKKAIQAIEGDDLSGASEEIDNILK